MIRFVMNMFPIIQLVFLKNSRKNNLKILDFRFNEINGGSIEIKCAKKKSKLKSNTKKFVI